MAESTSTTTPTQQHHNRPAGDNDDDSDAAGSYHSDSSFDPADDQDWADWVEEEAPTLAIFPNADGTLPLLPSATAALDDAAGKGCDLRTTVRKLSLDTLAAIRLVNRIRRLHLDPKHVAALTGEEEWWNSEEDLRPVEGGQDDPLLQYDFQQDGDDDVAASTDADAPQQKQQKQRNDEIDSLKQQLDATRATLAELQSRLLANMGLSSESLDHDRRGPIAGLKPTHRLAKVTPGGKEGRDDDSHYFDSYASNDIHQTMISDRARTLSYARFILSPANAHLIRGKTVMDVGCGSGILSLFCARAGAKRVLAIDASNVAKRARANVEENGFDHVITVVQGKIEDLDDELSPYVGQVDLIVSEWMGYFLLYECMLPSVLYARDRYLNPSTGLLAPSHCRMTLAAIADEELLHDRIHFWNDVHGFRMSEMQKGLYDEAYTEELKEEAVVSDVCDIYDLPLQVLSYRQPTFTSPFTLTTTRSGPIHAFASWFDTWFTPDSKPWPLSLDGSVEEKRDTVGGELLPLVPCTVKPPTEEDVYGLNLQGSAAVVAEKEEERGKGEIVSFTTGPHGLMTHWKQTVFLLKQPIEAQKGSVITGVIEVTQSKDNSRELDVEIHFEVRSPEQGAVRKKGEGVGARLVQVYKVR